MTSNILERVNAFLGQTEEFRTFSGMLEDLLKAGEEFKLENELMAEKHAEKDIAFVQLKIALDKANNRIKELEIRNQDLKETVSTSQINEERLMDQNKKFRRRIIELRQKTGFKVFEENLALIQEIEFYKDMLKGDDHGHQNQAELSKV
jgi:hypothetical protein